jgi:hypothetical protein
MSLRSRCSEERDDAADVFNVDERNASRAGTPALARDGHSRSL